MNEPGSGGLDMKSVSALVTIGIVLLVSVGGIGCLSQIMH